MNCLKIKKGLFYYLYSRNHSSTVKLCIFFTTVNILIDFEPSMLGINLDSDASVYSALATFYIFSKKELLSSTQTSTCLIILDVQLAFFLSKTYGVSAFLFLVPFMINFQRALVQFILSFNNYLIQAVLHP